MTETPFVVYPQANVPNQPVQPAPMQTQNQPSAQPSQPVQALPADLQSIEQQRQQLLQEMQQVIGNETGLQQQLDQLGNQAQGIEARREQISKQLETLNKQETALYSKNSERLAMLVKSQPIQPATPVSQPVQTQPAPATQPQPVMSQATVAQPATTLASEGDQRLAMIRNTLLERLMQVPPQGISPEEIAGLMNPATMVYLSPDLNGIVLINGAHQLHVPSADLIAAGALVDLTALPKLQQ